MNDYFRKWTGRCWLREWDMDGNAIEVGHLLRLYHWPLLEPPLTNSYLWRAERRRGMAIMLVSVTTGQVLPMSRTMATLLIKVEEPAWLNIADYAEQLHWAEVFECGFSLTTYQGGRGLRLHVDRRGAVGVFRFTAAEVRRWKHDPNVGRALLTEALFLLLHPRKAQRLRAETVAIPAKDLEAFARKMRRTVKAQQAAVKVYDSQDILRVSR